MDAYINGKIVDGTKDMQVKEGYAILVEHGKIKDIVLQEEADLNGYDIVDLTRREQEFPHLYIGGGMNCDKHGVLFCLYCQLVV